jgi:hypothetical protein
VRDDSDGGHIASSSSWRGLRVWSRIISLSSFFAFDKAKGVASDVMGEIGSRSGQISRLLWKWPLVRLECASEFENGWGLDLFKSTNNQEIPPKSILTW